MRVKIYWPNWLNYRSNNREMSSSDSMMQALHYPAFDTLVSTTVEAPELAAGEVLLKVAACGICGSELETFKAQSVRRQPPLIMGHEFCGTVVAVSSEDQNALLGRNFVSNSVVPCGRCIRCRRGDTHLCAHRQIFGMHRAGAFAEFVNVPAEVLIPWPSELSAEAAAMTEPLANGVHVVNLTRHLPVHTALVIGAGPIGLMAQQALQVMRGATVFVCDLSEGRLEVAKRLGAAEVFPSGTTNIHEELLKRTEGEGVDLVVDAVGAAQTKKLSLDCLRPGGATVWIGLHADNMELATYQITLPEKQILGTYAAKKDELEYALELMRTGRVDVTSWTEIARLGDSVEMFHRMLRPGPNDIKAVIMP
jgi:L-iditol 2-dehydrogenase